ncbi:hypothetical protein C8F04DRAFT_1127499 [Mycena alexandri]|uniref:Uncharacterized protein n=1 Tax=Mycena alexandri TaxID=1745969 RepID=A0AAD6WSR9_9AGAR|nr:hypothetical protein C8F04DRAFT_1127499 [Mycena alexandri]
MTPLLILCLSPPALIFANIVNSTCTSFRSGFSPGEALPPLCPDGTFCPDEGSGCRTLVPPGHPCELNRDEQCGPPSSWKDLASTQNFNGSICLRMPNVTLGDWCQITNTVTRDNCQSQLYCNPTELLCEHTLPLDSPCQVDPECTSFNCAAGRCANPPETSTSYPAVAMCFDCHLCRLMVAICGFLTLTHKQHRLDRSRELRDYYYQQIGLRRSLIALHVAAADRCMGEKVVG